MDFTEFLNPGISVFTEFFTKSFLVGSAVVGNEMQLDPFNLEKNVSCYDNMNPVLFSGPSLSDVTKMTGKLCERTSEENRSL